MPLGGSFHLTRPRRSPRWLLLREQRLWSSSLIGLWVGDILVLGAGNAVVNWPGLMGGTISGAAIFRGARFRGRRAIIADAGTIGRLQSNIGTVINSVSVVAVMPALPFPTFEVAAATGATDPGSHSHFVSGFSTLSIMYSDGTTVYIDGIATTTATPGTHYFQSDDALCAQTVIYMGYSGAPWGWLAPVSVLAVKSAVSSGAPQRLVERKILGEYSNLVA
jgi:hypothetical protein